MFHRTEIPAQGNSSHPNDSTVVFLHEDMIETSTEKQLQAMMSHLYIRHIRVMPDCHVGHGSALVSLHMLTSTTSSLLMLGKAEKNITYTSLSIL